jgi:hypothetical protein
MPQNITNKRNYCIIAKDKKENSQIIAWPYCKKNQWKYNRKTKQIKSMYSKKCIDLEKHRLVQKKCKNNKTQKWKYHKKQWISLKNKKCMDIQFGSYNNGLMIYPCHNGPNQKFE